jgi:hypothetical protein
MLSFEGPIQPSFTAKIRSDLLEALAPLEHPGLTRLEWGGDEGCEFELGQPELTALGKSLGSSLQFMGLGNATLTPSFWPALLRELPGLKQLSLHRHVTGAVSQSDILAFCKDVPGPFTLVLDDYVCSAAGRQQLQSQLDALPQGSQVVIQDPKTANRAWALANGFTFLDTYLDAIIASEAFNHVLDTLF